MPTERTFEDEDAAERFMERRRESDMFTNVTMEHNERLLRSDQYIVRYENDRTTTIRDSSRAGEYVSPANHNADHNLTVTHETPSTITDSTERRNERRARNLIDALEELRHEGLIDRFEFNTNTDGGSLEVEEIYQRVSPSYISNLENRFLNITRTFEDANLEADHHGQSGLTSSSRTIRITYTIQSQYRSIIGRLADTEEPHTSLTEQPRTVVNPFTSENNDVSEVYNTTEEPDPEEHLDFTEEELGEGLFKVIGRSSVDHSVTLSRVNGTQRKHLEVPEYVYIRIQEGDILYFKNNKLKGKRSELK